MQRSFRLLGNLIGSFGADGAPLQRGGAEQSSTLLLWQLLSPISGNAIRGSCVTTAPSSTLADYTEKGKKVSQARLAVEMLGTRETARHNDAAEKLCNFTMTPPISTQQEIVSHSQASVTSVVSG